MNATQLAKTANGKAVEELDVLVVGAGFAGLYQLDHPRKLGCKVAMRQPSRWSSRIREPPAARPDGDGQQRLEYR